MGPEQARGSLILRLRRRASHHGVEARQDDGDVVLLPDESIGSRIERPNFGAHVFGPGEQQARHAPQRRVQPDAPDDRRPVDAGQHAIDDNPARPHVGCKLEPFLAGPGDQHAIGGQFQRPPQLFPERHAVVDDEDRLARGSARGFSPAHQLPRAGDQIGRLVGLADVLVGAGGEAADAVADFGLARQQNHRRRAGAWSLANFTQQLDAVGVGQQDVEDDQGELVLGERFAGVRAGGAWRDGKPRRFQRLDEIHADSQAVVDDEHRRVHGLASASATASETSAGAISSRRSTRQAAPSDAASRGMP